MFKRKLAALDYVKEYNPQGKGKQSFHLFPTVSSF